MSDTKPTAGAFIVSGDLMLGGTKHPSMSACEVIREGFKKFLDKEGLPPQDVSIEELPARCEDGAHRWRLSSGPKSCEVSLLLTGLETPLLRVVLEKMGMTAASDLI